MYNRLCIDRGIVYGVLVALVIISAAYWMWRQDRYTPDTTTGIVSADVEHYLQRLKVVDTAPRHHYQQQHQDAPTTPQVTTDAADDRDGETVQPSPHHHRRHHRTPPLMIDDRRRQMVPTIYDRDVAVAESDYRKLSDPLTEPGRRTSRDQIPPAFVAQWLNVPTQPWDDSPTPVGYLYREHTGDGASLSHHHDNLIRLIARRDRYRSTRYIYYALTHDGIKIQLHDHKRDELFNGDTVHIPELGGELRVRLYKHDDPYYNPYVL